MIQRGLTLLEVLVSTLIVTTGLLFLQASITDNLEKSDRAVKRRAGATLARQKLEQYLSEGSGSGTEGTFEEEGFPNYRFQIVEEEVTIGETGKMQRVKVTVRYMSPDDDEFNDQNQQNNDFTLTTFKKSELEQ